MKAFTATQSSQSLLTSGQLSHNILFDINQTEEGSQSLLTSGQLSRGEKGRKTMEKKYWSQSLRTSGQLSQLLKKLLLT